MIKKARRLLPLFVPASYNLEIDITKRKERIFSGTVTLRGSTKQKTREIVLHGKDLEIADALVDGEIASVKIEKSDDEIIVETKEDLEIGEHEILLRFSGIISDGMHGLYPCYFKHDGKDKELLMTQLESHHAREMFPCIDEPEAKATFSLTLKTEKDITVLGNMPILEQKITDNALITKFDETPKMSTYLLALVAGELNYLETKSKNGVSIKAYATPDKVEFTRFSLELTAKTLDYYDEYFEVKYPLEKCDLVAVPDFSAGAMENWGLITFRESCMLVDPENTATDTREWIAGVVTHELSHQWFGNLVTMKWWDDLWLNESFANWMDKYCVDHLFPEWQVWEQFGGGNQQYAFKRDGLANVQAVKQSVNHPDELHSLFDGAIVYTKGSCLIRMLHDYLGAETFRDGLRIYMSRHAYGNTEADDLWQALSEASGKDVKSFMDKWIHQPGHPVLSVEVKDDTINLEQERFYANPLEKEKGVKTIWPLPLLSDQIAEDIMKDQAMTTSRKSKDLVLVNKGYKGFYHTKYDSNHLNKLSESIREGKLEAVDRLSLLADGLALAKSGTLSTFSLASLLKDYDEEKEYPVWQSIIAVIGALRLLVNEDTRYKTNLQSYIKKIIRAEYNRLDWEFNKEESYFDKLLRPGLIALMSYSEDEKTVKRLLDMFDEAKEPEHLPADVRSIVYSTASREMGESAYIKLLDWYKKTSSSEERINIAAGITATKDEAIAKKITEHFNSKLIKSQDFYYWLVYLMRNKYGEDITWNWLKENWQWVKTKFKGGHDYADIPKYVASCMSTRDKLVEYKEFFEPKMDELDLALNIKQGIEDIEAKVLWRERDLEDVFKLLKEF